jgi:hypothetical protein
VADLKTLSGETHVLKEYTLGGVFLNRGNDFNPPIDPDRAEPQIALKTERILRVERRWSS